MRRLPVLLVLAFLLAACGGGDDDATAPSTDPVASTDAAPDESTTTTSSTTTTTSTTTTSTTTTTTAAPAVESIPTPEASTVADLLALDRPIVAGHAGGDRAYPHSTMYGFAEAARAGADVLEMDVQLTGDGVLIVQHDDTVDATTETTGPVRDLTLDQIQALDNGYWWSDEWRSQAEPDTAYVWRGVRTGPVRNLTLDQIQALDSGYWWSDEWRSQAEPDTAYVWRGVRTGASEPPPGYTADDFKVETFQAVAERFPEHVLDIEIKVPRGDDDEPDLDFAIAGARELADLIDGLGLTERVIVTSFSVEVMTAFREFAPEVATSPSEAETFAWYLGTGTIHPNDLVAQVPPTFGDIDVLAPDIVERVKAEGLDIWIWPNDSDAQENGDFYAEVIARGADGIIAGRPAEAVERYRADGLIP